MDERAWFENARAAGTVVQVTCSSALYSCCGKGFVLREGYEQVYRGYAHSVDDVGILVVAVGIGTLTYTVRVGWTDLLDWSAP